jgi:ACS family hexuronate transporter-like MFS transporter
MAAPLIAIPLEQRFGFRAAFLGTAVIGLIWVPVWIAVAFAPAARRALDRGSVIEAGSEAALPPPPPALATATHPAVLRTLVIVLGQSPLLAFLLLWSSKYLVDDHGLTQGEVKPYLVVPPLLFDAGAILFGHFASRRSRLRRDGQPPLALFALAAALCMLGAAVPLGRSPGEAIAIAGLCMAGGGGISALTTADMLSRVHPRAVSTAGGVGAAAQSLAYIVASPLIGRALGQGAGYPAVFVTLGALVLPAAVIWILWAPPPPHEEQRPVEAALD